MNSERTRIGIDVGARLYYVARVDHGGGRAEVKALARFQPGQLEGHHLVEGGEIVWSIPDDQAVVMNLYAPSNGDLPGETSARFELCQSLLDDEHEFHCEIVDTGRKDRYLGVALRRDSDRRVAPVLSKNARDAAEPSWCLRALALGRGYSAFCRTTGGDLVCLADFADQLASLCLIFHDRIVGLGRMKLDRSVDDDADATARTAKELKTVVNFNLARVAKEGVTVPLSAMVVSGHGATTDLAEAIEEYFPGMTTSPVISTGFFSERGTIEKIPMDKYLVALGLTV